MGLKPQNPVRVQQFALIILDGLRINLLSLRSEGCVNLWAIDQKLSAIAIITK